MYPARPDYQSTPTSELSDNGAMPSSRQYLFNSAFHVIIAIAICFVTGCAQKPILVITSGGLGFSQMGEVRRAIEKQCPNADVVSAGFWDAYKSDMAQIIRDKPHDHIVLVGHSLGCQTIAQTAGKVSKVDLAVLIDPAWDDIRLPRNIQQCLWYRRSEFGFEREANVTGASGFITIKGGHNDIPQSPQLIAAVVKAINGIPVKNHR
jgi:pimeloyl-ACP methyl ester carboxylesterase